MGIEEYVNLISDNIELVSNASNQYGNFTLMVEDLCWVC